MRLRSSAVYSVLAVWIGLVSVGFAVLLAGKSEPGTTGQVPTSWPRQSSLVLDPLHPTLVMAVHPHCPCTRASLDNLARLLTQLPHRLRVILLFLQPDEVVEGWERTDLWHSAKSFPDTVVIVDRGGVESERFGARTSGHVLLYHQDGNLLFSGGITPARGHAGDNVALDRLFACLQGKAMEAKNEAVFGCPLRNSCSECEKD